MDASSYSNTLDGLSQLQTQEQELYQQLETPTLTAEERATLIGQVNSLSQQRIALYTNLKTQYVQSQQTSILHDQTLDQSMMAISVLENALDQSKRKLNQLENQQFNKLRLVEINTYFGKRNQAHSNVMITVIYICIPVIILLVFAQHGILPPNLTKFFLGIVFIWGTWKLGEQLIDMSNRSAMNWDEYQWEFNPANAPSPLPLSSNSSNSNSSNPWTVSSLTCIGSACCDPTTATYDATQNKCIPNTTSTSSTTSSTTSTSKEEPFRGLDKYVASQVKFFPIPNDTTVRPLFA